LGHQPRASADEVMEQARRQFLSAGRGTLDAFDQLAVQLAEQPAAEQLLTPLRRELHRLNGSAATFGYPRIGRMAAALEGAVKKWAADPTLDRDRRAPIVARFARSLREQMMTDAQTAALAARRLLIVGLRDAVAVPLTTEASARGFQVERAGGDELEEALADGALQAVIAGESTTALMNLHGVARLLLRSRDVAGVAVNAPAAPGSAGIRELDMRTEPAEVLDVLEAISDFEREATGSVLAVDDDPVMRTIVRVAAEQLNLSIETVADPAAFRAALSTMVLSLVVVDVDLGGANGLDLVRDVRARPALASVPVLVLSGHADVGTRDAAFHAGADDYMLKPFAPAEFQRRVSALFDLTRRRLASTGIHASSGVSLPSRTLRELEAALVQRGRSNVSLGVVAPTDALGSPRASAAWHRECRRIASVVVSGGGMAGLVDELTLAILMNGQSVPTVAWLSAQAGERPEDTPPWTAGVISATALGPDATVGAMLAAARDARNAAREADLPAREWDAADADVAPDVVVVEDDAPLADLIAFALESRGLTHRRYADGASAMEGLLKMRSRRGRPMVLLDVDLPGLDGHSLHERLSLARPGQFDVIFLSVHGSEADQLRALQAGAVDYLVKPVSLRVLAAKLTAWRARAKPE
jgi:DNA-binding response OmpR family regulator/HPt (histidine-containing phosphotransfer) domain-containing protein